MRPAARRATTEMPGLGKGDLLNPQFGDRLAMTVTPPDALFRLVAERDDLRSFALAHDGRADARLADGRPTDDQFLAVVREQHAVEDDGRVDVAVDVIEAQDVAFADFELAAMSFDDGVHA